MYQHTSRCLRALKKPEQLSGKELGRSVNRNQPGHP